MIADAKPLSPFPDPELGLKEELFRRYKKEHWPDGRFSGVGLPFKRPPSFNRSKFSNAEDVLVDQGTRFDGWGVLACFVGDAQQSVLAGDGETEYHFRPEHDPLPHNHAHSVIAHEPAPNREPSSLVRKEFRTRLGQRMRRIIPSAM